MNRADRRRHRKLAKTAAKNAKTAQSASSSSEQRAATSLPELDIALQHHGAGRLPEAEGICQKILKTDPNQPVALHLLGVIAHQVGKNDTAVELITKALTITPEYAEAHNNLGTALKELGRVDEAAASYHQALSIKPDYAEAHYNLGTMQQNLGNLDEAMDSYHRALAIKPDLAKAHNNLGAALKELGRLDEAVDSYHQALAINPNYAEVHNNLGIALQIVGRLEEAVANYHKALAIKPDYAEALGNLGNALRELGRLDEALANYRRALAIKPDLAEVHRHMALTKIHTEFDQDIQAMERAFTKPGISDEKRMHLAFSLGKAFEDLQQHEKAFDFFVVGNSIKRKEFSYSINDDANLFKMLKEVFDVPFFAKHQGAGCGDKTPIFVVGMPRSGTTLVEQILASHPQVHGAGELVVLNRIVSDFFDTESWDNFSKNIQQADDNAFEQLGEKYVMEIKERFRKSRFIIDKMPSNYLNIGIIKLALPNAKIIHCYRNPLDNILSIKKTFALQNLCTTSPFWGKTALFI